MSWIRMWKFMRMIDLNVLGKYLVKFRESWIRRAQICKTWYEKVCKKPPVQAVFVIIIVIKE